MILHLTECPRDAMQGIKTFIPTSKKIEYLNQLLDIGFDTLDFGSFVSAKTIPQMSDTADVITELNTKTSTKLLSIIANFKGATQALQFKNIAILGYPFSIS
ncbi:MAG: hydroxymethylglutaryl-CoA lyase, partial [Bacteroidia bacterium]